MTSMKHMCFLREPRTEIVVGEPRTDLPIIPKLIKALPQEVNRVRSNRLSMYRNQTSRANTNAQCICMVA